MFHLIVLQKLYKMPSKGVGVFWLADVFVTVDENAVYRVKNFELSG